MSNKFQNSSLVSAFSKDSVDFIYDDGSRTTEGKTCVEPEIFFLQECYIMLTPHTITTDGRLISLYGYFSVGFLDHTDPGSIYVHDKKLIDSVLLKRDDNTERISYLEYMVNRTR